MQSRETNRFEVRDEDGNVDVALELTDVINARSLSGPATKDGLKSYRLSSGEALNRISGVDGVTFLAVRTGKNWRIV